MIPATAEGGSKVRAEHVERKAYVYVRQSSMRQVRQHNESARRQYELVDWICGVGWPKERVVQVRVRVVRPMRSRIVGDFQRACVIAAMLEICLKKWCP